MTNTSDHTQWQVKETKTINTSGFGFSVTAMPRFILFGEEVNLPVKGEEVIRITEIRNMNIRERIKLLNNEKELSELYSEFADEDMDLANIGNDHYISMIEEEENY